MKISLPIFKSNWINYLIICKRKHLLTWKVSILCSRHPMPRITRWLRVAVRPLTYLLGCKKFLKSRLILLVRCARFKLIKMLEPGRKRTKKELLTSNSKYLRSNPMMYQWQTTSRSLWAHIIGNHPTKRIVKWSTPTITISYSNVESKSIMYIL